MTLNNRKNVKPEQLQNVLFIVENNSFPRDMRVYNECMTLAKSEQYKCYVISPRGEKENFIDLIEDKVKCFRYPSFEANDVKGLFVEYVITAFFYLFLIPLIVFRYKINIIHVANPPDFILFVCAWSKIFGVKLIFDQHDLSVESFEMKVGSGKFKSIFSYALSLFEKLSFRLADLAVATNKSIEAYEKKRVSGVKTCVIRNSNHVQYKKISDIPKTASNRLRLGYFGVLGKESGAENLVYICDKLRNKHIDFEMIIIGDGSGMELLKKLVAKNNLSDNFIFEGFVGFSSAVAHIVNFDFGILPWGDCKKHHMHTAAKVMDYMCCGVPVCSLKLKEQIVSAGNIGIFADNFDDMVDAILKIYANRNDYEDIRDVTLKYFNENRSWEIEGRKLMKHYELLSVPGDA